MKIGVIITSFFPSVAYGGPVYSTIQRVIELVRRGHDVTVLTSNVLDPHIHEYIFPGMEEHQLGFKIIRFPSVMLVRHFSGVVSFPMLKWLHLHSQEFDVFHISYSRELIPILSAHLIMKEFRSKVFLQTHGMLNRRDGPRKWIDFLITKPHLKRANGVIVLQQHENEVIQEISQHAKRFIVPNGILLNSTIPTWNGLNEHQPIILFLARLHPRKKVVDFINAAKIVVSLKRNVHFRIVGPDGGEESLAREMIRMYGLEANFNIVGAVSREQALREFAQASIYVLPSIDEPFATSITEAMSVGIPIVVTNSVHNLDLLLKWNAVESVEPTAVALATGVLHLLNNKDLCEMRSRNGRQLVSSELDIEKTIGILELIYSK